MTQKPTYEELEYRVQVLERESVWREQAEEELWKSEERLKIILDSIPAGIVIINAQSHIIVDANPAAIQMIGSSKEKVVGSICHKYICPAEKGACPITDLGQKVDNSERILLKANGKETPIIKTVSNMKIGDQEYLIESFIDITAQKKAVIEQTRTAVELSQLIDTANAPIFGVDTEGKINEWNQMVASITGYGKDEVMGEDLVEQYITDEYKSAVKEVLDKAFEGTETDNYEVPLYTKDGRWVMVLLNATTRRDADSNIVGVVGVGQDITELSEHRENLKGLVRIRTEELNQALFATEKARDRMDGILKSVADGLIVTDVYNRVVLMNRVAEDFLGVRLTEVIDRPIDFAIKEKTLREKVRGTLDNKSTGYQFDFEIPDDDPKHTKIMRARTSIIHDREGKQAGIVTIIHDVTHEREVDRMKTEFISTAAHELRTPLTSILGYAEIVLNNGNLLAEEKNEFLNYIHQQAYSLAGIVDDLLDISRIESGKGSSLNKELCRVGSAIKQLVPFYKGHKKNHRFEIKLPEENTELSVDKAKMFQVLKNIIDNAIKYSPSGGLIRVKGEIVNGDYQVSVEDQGIGITPEQMEHVFDKFYRADTFQTKGIKGAGLGLSIVKYIVEAHGGKVWVESEFGKGTTVKFTLPMEELRN